MVFHLSDHRGDATPGNKAYGITMDLKEYHESLIERDYRYNKPGIGKTP